MTDAPMRFLLMFICSLITSVGRPGLLLADEPTQVVVDDWLSYQSAPCDNPYTGLVPYRRPADGRFPYAMEFDYLSLSDLMFGFDEFRWDALDHRIADIASRGRHTIFRVYLEYPGKLDAIPQFLIDGGLKVTRWTNTNTAPFPAKDCVTPDYSDPQLIKALEAFIAALGRRYDSDPRVAYVTAGLLGTWGEWHTFPRNDLWAPKSTQSAVMTAYAKAFDRVPVLLRYPSGGEPAYASTTARPFGYHDDSFAWATCTTDRPEDNWYFEPRLAAAGLGDIWKTEPIGGEIRPEVWGCVFDEPSCAPTGQSFAECRDALHVTWLLDTGMSREQASADRMERALTQVQRMGYEFHISAAAVSRVGSAQGELRVQTTIRNTGIAPFYHRGWQPTFALLPIDAAGNSNGSIEASTETTHSFGGLLPDDATDWVTTIKLSNVAPGSYVVAMTVGSNIPNGKPIRFANAGQDRHVDGWASFATIHVP